MSQAKGHTTILGTSAVSAPRNAWRRIYFKEATVIASISYQADYNGTDDDLANESMPADSYLEAPVTSITLTSGACICYDQ
jgi:hypothetical protein